jgi:hypothetical protein
MRSIEARQRAIECGMRAQMADDDASRDFYRQMRDVWLDLAQECDRLQASEDTPIDAAKPLH